MDYYNWTIAIRLFQLHYYNCTITIGLLDYYNWTIAIRLFQLHYYNCTITIGLLHYYNCTIAIRLFQLHYYNCTITIGLLHYYNCTITIGLLDYYNWTISIRLLQLHYYICTIYLIYIAIYHKIGILSTMAFHMFIHNVKFKYDLAGLQKSTMSVHKNLLTFKIILRIYVVALTKHIFTTNAKFNGECLQAYRAQILLQN